MKLLQIVIRIPAVIMSLNVMLAPVSQTYGSVTASRTVQEVVTRMRKTVVSCRYSSYIAVMRIDLIHTDDNFLSSSSCRTTIIHFNVIPYITTNIFCKLWKSSSQLEFVNN